MEFMKQRTIRICSFRTLYWSVYGGFQFSFLLTGKHRAERRESGQTCGRTRDTNSPINEVPCESHLARYDKVNVRERQTVDSRSIWDAADTV